MAKVMILGAGGFGCSLAVMCQKMGHQVTLWTPFEEAAAKLAQDREQPKLLPGVVLPQEVFVTNQVIAASEAELVLIVTPSFAVRSACQAVAEAILPGVPVACASKGLEPETYHLLSDVVEQELPKNPAVVLTGPSHAEEVARGVPTSIVAASKSRLSAELVQDVLMNPTLRIYVNDDVIGVQLGGALKNVIALAAGICDGLALGDNSKAALMTRGITEIARLGVAMGAKTETFAGLSGIGDLIVTCTSMHSRNRRAGLLIGQGLTAKQAIEQVGQTVEGYTSALCAYMLAQKVGIEMPIITETYRILYEDKDPTQAIHDLMGRPKRHESEVIWLLTK